MEKSNVEKLAEEIIEENNRLKMKLDDCNCKIKVMQNHIDSINRLPLLKNHSRPKYLRVT